MMYNLPKFDSEKAAKIGIKLTKSNVPTIKAHCPGFKNVVKAISTGGQTGPHTMCHNGRY